MSADTPLLRPLLPPILPPLLELLSLDQLPRTGWITAGVPNPESVAGHVVSAAHLALGLAPRIEPPLELGSVLTILLVHDAPEALSGDLPKRAANHLPQGSKAAMEDGLARELLAPLGPSALAAFASFRAQGSREARFARLCDKLQLGVRLLGYVLAGQRGLEDFQGGLEALDCSEFPPAADLRDEILAALEGAS